MKKSNDNQTMSEDMEEKKKLATFVKSVHKDLRKKFKNGEKDAKDIWKEHCQNTGKLQDYAEAMKKLATVHWGKQQQERVHWCRKTLLEYFRGGMKKCIEKDQRRVQRLSKQTEEPDITTHHHQLEKVLSGRYLDISTSLHEKPLVLDVGSCYNPFKQMEEFKVIGIDLHPATEDVYQCDFLSLKVEDPVQTSCPLANLRSPITRLPSCVFNVIIFCLLLEYFPSCHQRWRCCVQAHKLLAPNGLLLVITPDSHKQHRNSAMIRSWISAITSLGFSKWKYEKLEHIHCIVFRKIQDECSVNDDMADLMFIHQDALQESSQEDASTEDGLFIERNDEQIRQTMLELPGFVSDSED